MNIFSRGANPSKFAVKDPALNGIHLDSESAPFTSGVGTIIEEEHQLLTLVRQGMLSSNGINTAGIRRILTNHLQQSEEIIALLEFYLELLPIPERFAVLRSGALLHLRVTRPTAKGLSLLNQLADIHGHLFRTLELLRKSLRNSDEMRVLSGIAQRHEDMGWMLNALTNEDARASDPRPSPVVASELNLSEQKWETDGGLVKSRK